MVNEFSTLSSEQISGFQFYTKRMEHSFLETLKKKIALFSQYSAEKPPVFTQLYSCSVLWRGLLTMDSFGLGIGYVFVLFGPAHTR